MMIRLVSNSIARSFLFAALIVCWSGAMTGCSSDDASDESRNVAASHTRANAADIEDDRILDDDTLVLVTTQPTIRFRTAQLLSNDVIEIDALTFDWLDEDDDPVATITTAKGGTVTAWTDGIGWDWIYTAPDDDTFDGNDVFRYRACLEAAYGGDCETATVSVQRVDPQIVSTNSFSTTIQNFDTDTDIHVFVDYVQVDTGHADEGEDWTWNYDETLNPREVHRVDIVLLAGGVISQGIVYVPEVVLNDYNVGTVIQGESVSLDATDILADVPTADPDSLTLDPDGVLHEEIGVLSGNAADGFTVALHPDFQGTVSFSYRVCPFGWDMDLLDLGDGCKTAQVQLFVEEAVRLTSHNDGASTGLRPAFSGTATPGSTVTLFVDGIEDGTAEAEEGMWTIAPATALSVTGGTNTHTIKVVADNGSEASISIHVFEAQFDPIQDTLYAVQGMPFTFDSLELVENDGLDANPASFVLNKSTTNGALTQNEDGTYTYAPSGTAAQDRFTYTICAFITVEDDLCADSVQVTINARKSSEVNRIPTETMEVGINEENVTFKLNGKTVSATSSVDGDEQIFWAIDEELLPNRVYLVEITVNGAKQPDMYVMFEKEEDDNGDGDPNETDPETEDPFANVPGDAKITRPVDGSSTGATDPLIVGEGKPGSKVKLYIWDELEATITVNEDGEWEYTPHLPVGEYRLAVEGDDGSRHIIFLTIEDGSYKGDVLIDSPSPDERIPHLSPMVSGTSSAGTSVLIYIDGLKVGQVFADQDGYWFWQARDLDEGTHDLRVVGVNGSVDERSFLVYEVIDIEKSSGCAAMSNQDPVNQSTLFGLLMVLFSLTWLRRKAA